MAVNFTLSEFDLEAIDLITSQILPLLVYVTIAGFILEIIVALAFIYIIITKRLANLKGLLCLFTVGYVTDIISIICWLMSWIHNFESHFWLNAAEVSYDYVELSGSVWNTLLALNRCTALTWPIRYSRIWSFKNVCFIAIPIILVFPVLLIGFILFDERFYTEGL